VDQTVVELLLLLRMSMHQLEAQGADQTVGQVLLLPRGFEELRSPGAYKNEVRERVLERSVHGCLVYLYPDLRSGPNQAARALGPTANLKTYHTLK
jgi:hypothetical protein